MILDLRISMPDAVNSVIHGETIETANLINI